MPSGKDVLALVAGVGERGDLAKNAGDLIGDGLYIAGIHGAVVGARGQGNGLRELRNDASQGRVGHLKPAGDQVRALRKGVVLLNLVQQQHILTRQRPDPGSGS